MAAAITLARAGHAPIVIERQRIAGPCVCGGFLGWDAIAGLAGLGLSIETLGAHPITHIRLIVGKASAEARLPSLAAGLSRQTLDRAMIDQARALGTGIEQGVTIRTIDPRERALGLADGGKIAGEALFLASGKHDLRGSPRPHAALGSDPAIGLRTALLPSPALAGVLRHRIELHLFRGGYAGLLMQEDGMINLCLSIARSRLADADGRPERLIASLADEAPILAERLGAATDQRPWLAIAAIPYGWRATTSDPGIFRIGDQAATIASLAGDGIAIALASGQSAARHLLAQGAQTAPYWQANFARRAARPLGIAGGLKHLAEQGRYGPAAITLIRTFPAAIGLLARLTRIGI